MRKPGVTASSRLTRQQAADIEQVLRGYLSGLAYMLDPDFEAETAVIGDILASASAIVRVICPLLPGGCEASPQSRLGLVPQLHAPLQLAAA